MGKYIAKRIAYMIPVILGVTLLVFFIMHLAPGNPAQIILGENATAEQIATLEHEMGLDQPLLVQYVRYLGDLLHGDLGTSYSSGSSVTTEIMARFPYTIKLTLVAAIMSLVLALPLGIIAAVKQNTWVDNVSMIVALIGVSMPIFWLALMLIMLFSVKLGWLPVYGADSWKSIILPAISLGFMNMASISRTTRSSMVETLRQDYIRTAYAKGLSKTTIIMRHAFRNGMLPTITVIGLEIGQMLGGSVLTETVFAWPGVGRLMILAINARDTPLVMGCILLMTVCFSVVNLVVDLLYGVVDPRVRTMYR
ncbi:MAG: ABC transporter permease [Oscillospiraceae bacterium]|nr:ABC transporter permease [Oscillospiraceae bacterium]